MGQKVMTRLVGLFAHENPLAINQGPQSWYRAQLRALQKSKWEALAHADHAEYSRLQRVVVDDYQPRWLRKGQVHISWGDAKFAPNSPFSRL